MQEDAHNQDPQSHPDQNRVQADANKALTRHKQPLVRRYLFFAFLSALFGGLSQYVESFDHNLLLPSLVIFFVSFIFGARSLWLLLRNHHATKLNAYLCSLPVLLVGLLLCGFLYWWESSSGPTVSPKVIRLHNGAEKIQTPIAVVNSTVYPMYCVMLQMVIKGKGVRADSLDIEMTDKEVVSPKFSTSDHEFSGYTTRFDYMHEQNRHIVFFVISSIPANGSRHLVVEGETPVASSAVISVIEYSKTFEVLKGRPSTNSFTPSGFKIPFGGTASNFSCDFSEPWIKNRFSVY